MKQRNFADVAARLFTAVMVMVVMFSCTNQDHEDSIAVATKKATPSGDGRRVGYDFKINCTTTINSATHNGLSWIGIYSGSESLEPEKVFEKKIQSQCSIESLKDSVRVGEDDAKPEQTGVSIDRKLENNKEIDDILITTSDNRVLKIRFSTDRPEDEEYMRVTYSHGFDQLDSAKLVNVEFEPIILTRAGGASSSKYVKETLYTKYFVEVATSCYKGDGSFKGKDLDTLMVKGVTVVLADNNTTNTKTGTGEKVINDTQQKDSVIITKTWTDGHKENMNFNTILNRYIESIEHREIIVPNFNDQTAGSSFSRVEGGESLVRKDNNWMIYGRKVTISKMTSVSGHVEEVRYTLYQERADFSYEGITHSFGYVDWQVGNYADDFKVAAISTMSGYDELDYKNEIRTSYLGYVQFAKETISWFKESRHAVDYDVINASRIDYATYTLVSLDKVAIFNDGTSETVGKYSAQLPINVAPQSNWVINVYELGNYDSDDFSGSQTSKVAKTAEKFFSYNQYGYAYTNKVSGQINKFTVNVPNDIVFDDGDIKYTFKNSNLEAVKKSDNVVKVSEDDEKTSYKYTCTAGVTFGESSQDVTMPGTINVLDNTNHEHGKVKEVHFTTTPDESRAFYKSVCVLVFEDGYRKVGLSDNGANAFDFSMSSYKNVNSAVYSGGWIPAIAEDNAGARCMIWKDENGTAKRTLDFITATRNGWNNGHNTVTDVRRSAEISKSGYSVTLYLNGSAGQTLKF